MICRSRIGDDSESDFALRHIFQTLSNFSHIFLQLTGSGVTYECELKFAESLCEVMVLLGSSKLLRISSDYTVIFLYLQQVILHFAKFEQANVYRNLLWELSHP